MRQAPGRQGGPRDQHVPNAIDAFAEHTQLVCKIARVLLCISRECGYVCSVLLDCQSMFGLLESPDVLHNGPRVRCGVQNEVGHNVLTSLL